MKESRTQVLIVGGGPVGLALAIELGMRGIQCVLVERRDGSIPLPKMNGVNARTMEFCRRWGIVQRVRSAGWPPDFPRRMMFCTSARGHVLRRIDMGPMQGQVARAGGNSPESFMRCPQQWFDPILRERALEFPTNTLHYRTRLERFEDRGDGMVAEITDARTGETARIFADYMVACDGARSGVRDTLGIAADGNGELSYEINVYFESFSVFAGVPERKAVMSWLVGPEGVWGALSAVNGRSTWRLWLCRMDPATDLQRFDAAGYVRRAIGADVPFDLMGVLPWDRQQRVARQFRKGRVFLCGDAVHNLTPTGGFGMNTGIGDAVDLAWKLEAAYAGWAGAGLLDTYERERRPVAIRNVDEATHTYNQVMAIPAMPYLLEPGTQGEQERAALGDLLERGQLQREYRNEGIVLGYRYDPSPICIPDGTPAPADLVMSYTQNARPGSRAPHLWLDAQRSTIDLLLGSGFTLLRIGADAPEWPALDESAGRCGVPLQTVCVVHPDAEQLYGGKLVLVRPDGHVAWRGDTPADADHVIDVVRGAHCLDVPAGVPEIYGSVPPTLAPG